jgi:hypothetical protein
MGGSRLRIKMKLYIRCSDSHILIRPVGSLGDC